jgi:hypothetical protein
MLVFVAGCARISPHLELRADRPHRPRRHRPQPGSTGKPVGVRAPAQEGHPDLRVTGRRSCAPLTGPTDTRSLIFPCWPMAKLIPGNLTKGIEWHDAQSIERVDPF